MPARLDPIGRYLHVTLQSGRSPRFEAGEIARVPAHGS